MELQKEKKVEYIELIYDLVFVYLLGRNASLLDRVEAGFITLETFVSYLVSSLIVLQIWIYTTLFINRFGKNRLSDKLTILISMFLLYLMGANTIHGWDLNYGVFMGAWSLILLVLSCRYFLKLRTVADPTWRGHILQNAVMLLIQACFIVISIPVYILTGCAFGQWAILIGFIALPFLARFPTNFAHLTERVMLYVVFTFGDMILMIAGYFDDGFNFQTVFFALVSFLIVAGLFFSYGFVYDRLLDRSGERSGSLFMLLHVVLILALCCVTTALEFMLDDSVDSMPKLMMMFVSLLVFFLCLALTEHWSVRTYRFRRRFLILPLSCASVFLAAVLLTEGISGYLSAMIILAFVYTQLGTLLCMKNIPENGERRNGAG